MIFVITILTALIWYRPVADWLITQFGVPILLSKPLAFLGLWLGVDWLLGLCLGLAYRFLPEWVKRTWWNRVLGLAPAFVKSVVSLGVTFAILSLIPLPQDVKATIDESRVVQPLIQETGFATRWLESLLGGSFDEIFNFLTTPSAETTIELRPVAADKLHEEPSAEQALLELVNQERVQAGLKPLTLDAELQAVARDHSRDMWLKGYFSHTNPDGQGPFDRMQAAGVSYTYAGENLALAPSVAIAHAGLMRSPDHRANILEPKFGRLGIGIISAGAEGLMVTQNFRD